MTNVQRLPRAFVSLVIALAGLLPATAWAALECDADLEAPGLSQVNHQSVDVATLAAGAPVQFQFSTAPSLSLAIGVTAVTDAADLVRLSPAAVAAAGGAPNLFVVASDGTVAPSVLLTQSSASFIGTYFYVLGGIVNLTCKNAAAAIVTPVLAPGEYVACTAQRLVNGRAVDQVGASLPAENTFGDFDGPQYYGMWSYDDTKRETYMELSNTYYTRASATSVDDAAWLRQVVSLPADPTTQLPALQLAGACARTTAAPAQTHASFNVFTSTAPAGSLAIGASSQTVVPLTVTSAGVPSRIAVTTFLNFPDDSALTLALRDPSGRTIPLDGARSVSDTFISGKYLPAAIQGVAATGSWALIVTNSGSATGAVQQFTLNLTFDQ